MSASGLSNPGRGLKRKRNPLPDEQVSEIVPLRPYEVIMPFNDWRDQAVEWYNDWVQNPSVEKKQQLYVWGPKNSGKTLFFQLLLGNFDLNQT